MIRELSSAHTVRHCEDDKPGCPDAPTELHDSIRGHAESLLVDEIGDCAEVTEESFERPLEAPQGKVREVIFGVHKFMKQLAHVLPSASIGRVW